jgi:hypothetical protein
MEILEITSQKNKSFEGNEREKMKTREWTNEAEEKWTEGAVAGIYSAVLPTNSPMAYLNYF